MRARLGWEVNQTRPKQLPLRTWLERSKQANVRDLHALSLVPTSLADGCEPG